MLHRIVSRAGFAPGQHEPLPPPSAGVGGTAPAADGPNVATVLASALARGGFRLAFGMPGRHVQGLFQALPGAGLTPIVTRHEQGAVFMADGYARAGGGAALVVATAGPGAGNLVTGVANAFAEGTPVLCVAGASPRRLAGRGAFQELGDDHGAATDALFTPITRFCAQLGHPAQLGPSARAAMRALGAGGPAVLTIPYDVLEAPAPPLPSLRLVPPRPEPAEAELAAAAAWLARHPNALILAGRGALDAAEPLTRLAEALQIPVMTTLHGRGAIDEDHPLALGPQGFGASAWAEGWLRDHVPDVVLAVGTGLREVSTNVFEPAFQGRVALIHVTRDANALGRHYAPTVGAVADAERFLAALVARVPARGPNAALAAWKAATPRFDEAARTAAPGRVSPRAVVEALRAALGPDDVLVVDTGNAVPWSVRYYPVRRPRSYLAAVHLAAMGWGVAGAVGVQAARPQDRVVALVGDGCFQVAGMEVATAVQHGLPVVWVVLNDARYNMVHQGTTGCYGRPVPGCELSAVDCARVARGLGAVGIRVDDPAGLPGAIARALGCGRPAVVDVAIDPALVPPMASRLAALARLAERVP